MDARRLRYLKAMDIEVWQPRAQVEAAAAAAALQPPAAAPLSRPSLRQSLGSAPAAPSIVSEPMPMPMPVAAPDVRQATWAELTACIQLCTACALHRERKQPVFGVGNPQADWLIISDAPGEDEDRHGEPFVGRSGQMLNAMLHAAGLSREQVFITNVVKCRPPQDRDLKPNELAQCAGYLARQIDLVKPKVILCVGRVAARQLLQTETPIGKLRGQVHRLHERPMIVTYHPAFVLRSPQEKRRVWADLQLALQVYAEVTA